MVKKSRKKSTKKKSVKNKKKSSTKKKIKKSISEKDIPTLHLKTEHEIAMDFATKVYQKFNKIIKSIVLFGSKAKQSAVAESDMDIVIIIDDVSINWDLELIAWYREELDKILQSSPYKKSLHINTIKLSTWWEDLMKGDPVIMNIIRYGETMIDFAGFFEPIKFLLSKGKIKSTPEAIYSALQRAPMHIQRSRESELNSIEGLYWAMVDSAHAALIAAGKPPASPEHIAGNLSETFVNPGVIKSKYVDWYKEIFFLHKRIGHGEVTSLKGVEIDVWREKTEEFLKTMAQIVRGIVDKNG